SRWVQTRLAKPASVFPESSSGVDCPPHECQAPSKYAFGVAQIRNLLVSPNIMASRDDFFDATGARRLRRFSVQNFQAPFLLHRLWNFVRGSGVNAALLWLRRRRAVMYPRIAFCGTSGTARAFEFSDALPITNRRNGRLQICATRARRALNTHWSNAARSVASFAIGVLVSGMLPAIVAVTGCAPASPKGAGLSSKLFSGVQVIGTRGTGVGQFN